MPRVRRKEYRRSLVDVIASPYCWTSFGPLGQITKVYPKQKKFGSSPNSLLTMRLSASNASLLHTKNRAAPKTDPCGTKTCCSRLSRKASSHCIPVGLVAFQEIRNSGKTMWSLTAVLITWLCGNSMPHRHVSPVPRAHTSCVRMSFS